MSPATERFAPIRPGVLSTEVFDQIRARILDGGIAPGEAVRDSVLATAMGVSRSPVREALRILEQRGLVEKRPNHSYAVVTFTEADIAEIAMLRAGYEVMAVREIVARRIDIAPLRARLEELRGGPRSGRDRSSLAGADTRFHTEIVRLPRMPRLIAAYDTLRDQIDVMLANGFLRDIRFAETQYERHMALVDAIAAGIETGDPEPAIAEIREHVLGGMLFSGDATPVA
jgi:DNA-binding GntR family transcriptional regulator